MGQSKVTELRLREEVIHAREGVPMEMQTPHRQVGQVNKYIKNDDSHVTYGQRSKLQV